MSSDSNEVSAHQLAAAGRLQRSRRRWRVLAFIALIVAILALGGRFAMVNGVSGQQIARVEISGTIGTDRDRTALFKKLSDDPNVKAVILAINSPGGTTAAALSVLMADDGRLHDRHRL